MIKVENFKYRNIIDDTNIVINPGLNFLYGPNGTGKSTFLDCIANILNNYDGNITGNENIVYLNQSLYFSMRLKVKDFVQFVFTLDNITPYKKQFFRKASFYNLESFFENIWNKEVAVLSGGERRKLFFITISFLDREWYVFDEPFAGVDEEGKKQMLSIFNHLLSQDRSIIFTSHEILGFSEQHHVNIYEFSNKSIIKSNEKKFIKTTALT
ncbi:MULTISPECIES: ATP-binding cassette domain-containing protein [Bacillaceae]|uniref:ABC transporter domain-containing protein n=1 Tax=Alkalicoccobacillus plakortidis TaxID=444060 RepID=A0A9D5I1J8_9BACI|nr:MULTISPECIES: ATP-binding cassette domain-containing protein [Bacillaceae]KQL58306.1 hypothetical protein AN965_04405 [Alkalicoccobacillus plakortidis]